MVLFQFLTLTLILHASCQEKIKVLMITRQLDGDQFSVSDGHSLNCGSYAAKCISRNADGKCRACQCERNGTVLLRDARMSNFKCLVDHPGDCRIFLKGYPNNNPSFPLVDLSDDFLTIGQLVYSDNSDINIIKCMSKGFSYYELGRWETGKISFKFTNENSKMMLKLDDFDDISNLLGSVVCLDIKCVPASRGIQSCLKFKFSGRKIYTIQDGSVKLKVVPPSPITTTTHTLPKTTPSTKPKTPSPKPTTPSRKSTTPTPKETTASNKTIPSTSSTSTLTGTPTETSTTSSSTKISTSIESTKKVTKRPSITTKSVAPPTITTHTKEIDTHTTQKDTTFTHIHSTVIVGKVEVEKSRQNYYVIIIVLVTLIVIAVLTIITCLYIRWYRRRLYGAGGRIKRNNKQKKMSLAELIVASTVKKKGKRPRGESTISNVQSDDYQDLSTIGTVKNVDLYNNLDNKTKQNNDYIGLADINVKQCNERKNQADKKSKKNGQENSKISIKKNREKNKKNTNEYLTPEIYSSSYHYPEIASAINNSKGETKKDDHTNKMIEEHYYSSAQNQPNSNPINKKYAENHTYKVLDENYYASTNNLPNKVLESTANSTQPNNYYKTIEENYYSSTDNNKPAIYREIYGENSSSQSYAPLQQNECFSESSYGKLKTNEFQRNRTSAANEYKELNKGQVPSSEYKTLKY